MKDASGGVNKIGKRNKGRQKKVEEIEFYIMTSRKPCNIWLLKKSFYFVILTA